MNLKARLQKIKTPQEFQEFSRELESWVLGYDARRQNVVHATAALLLDAMTMYIWKNIDSREYYPECLLQLLMQNTMGDGDLDEYTELDSILTRNNRAVEQTDPYYSLYRLAPSAVRREASAYLGYALLHTCWHDAPSGAK